VKVVNEAFLDEAVFHVSPFIVLEHKAFDAMSGQIVATNSQDRSQEVRSDTMPGVSHGDALRPKALVGASDVLQDAEAGDVCFISWQ
jgi:hypothetical protein